MFFSSNDPNFTLYARHNKIRPKNTSGATPQTKFVPAFSSFSSFSIEKARNYCKQSNQMANTRQHAKARLNTITNTFQTAQCHQQAVLGSAFVSLSCFICFLL